MKRLATAVLLCGSVLGNPVWAGDAAAGKATYSVCQACHGVRGEGNAALNAPALAGQAEWYTARQLSNFKQGIRGTNPKDAFGAQMRPMAMTLADDNAVANVAAYTASLAAAKNSATLDGDSGKGKSLYGTCIACHGVKGEGNKALNAPALALLADWYLVRQLQNYKAGIRGTHAKDAFGAQMRPMAMTLADDQAIKDVTAYIVSLGQ
ncbi:MAG: cytochrome c [Gammaproteobacteria bacterium]|nr:cytochrome c [Gammaproteobacteria bacterium]